jgi:hypothetical protein
MSQLQSTPARMRACIQRADAEIARQKRIDAALNRWWRFYLEWKARLSPVTTKGRREHAGRGS